MRQSLTLAAFVQLELTERLDETWIVRRLNKQEAADLVLANFGFSSYFLAARQEPYLEVTARAEFLARTVWTGDIAALQEKKKGVDGAGDAAAKLPPYPETAVWIQEVWSSEAL